MVAVTDLVYMAAMPVVDIFLMASIGFFITRKGIMDGRIRQGLSQLLFWVFIPCLTFSKIGTSLNFKELAIWWILPVNMAYSIGIGLVVGYFSAKLLKVEPWFCKLEMCVIALGNVGNLPIVLVQSICTDASTVFSKSLPNGLCQERGIAYVAFSMWVASTFQFCVAINLMAKKDPEPITPPQKLEAPVKVPEIAIEMASDPVKLEDHNAEASRSEAFQEGNHLGTGFGQSDTANEQELFAVGESTQEERPAKLQSSPYAEPDTELTLDESAVLLHGGETSTVSNSQRDFDEDVGTGPTNLEGHESWNSKQPLEPSQSWGRWRIILEKMWAIRWSRYFNMPTIAALAGVSVGCISMLKNLLFGDAAPLGFLSQSITIMSGAMIPLMMLVLGSGLSKGPGNSGVSARVIIGTILVRLMVIPALGYGSVMLAKEVGLFHPPNPMFTLVLLMCHTTPTALNIQTVAILNQNGEAEIATLICWQYIASLIFVPLWMAVFISTLS